MHYEDLTLCRYHSGPYDADNWLVPLLTVGWLENPHEFTRGTAPDTFLEKLKKCASLARPAYSHLGFRGIHICSICEAQGHVSRFAPGWSQEVLIIPGYQVIYAAPGGIDHYVESHEYLPPPEFIDAVMRCPTYGSPEFQEALRLSNKGEAPPMVTAAEDRELTRRQIAEAIRQRETAKDPR